MPDLSCFSDLIDELLRTMIDKGIGLELNTSGLRQSIAQTMPPIEYFKRYKELGGELVTIGSDAHNISFIGSGIEKGMQMLQEVGFDYFAFYRERQPRMIKIY